MENLDGAVSSYMPVSHSIGHTAAGDPAPKILDLLSGILTDVVGLVFTLYLTGGLACVSLACLQRSAGRPAASSAFVATVTLLACSGPLIRFWPEIRAQTPRAFLFATVLGVTFRVRPLVFCMIGAGGLYLMLMLLLARAHRQHRGAPPADLFYVFVMPCLDEEAVVGASLGRLLRADRDDVRVLVVDDGSTDATSDIVRGVPDQRVWLLRREPPQARSGKGAALNAAVAHLAGRPEIAVRDPDKVIVVVVDADGRLDPHAIEAVAPYFGDRRTAGVQTGVRINNRASSLLARMQDIEFVLYTQIIQRGRSRLDNVGLGGNGQFARLSALRSLGPKPWAHSLTEDLDLGVRLLLAGWRIQFCPYADVHQQGVVRLRRLLRQRSRWFQGHIQAWRLLPQVLRQASARTLPDMVFHLTSPVLILLASLLSAAFALSAFAGLAGWLAGGPRPDPRAFAGAYLAAGCPALVGGLIYRKRERLSGGLGLVRLAGYIHLYILYVFVWFAAGWWALARVVSGRRSWHKTARSPEGRSAPAAAETVRAGRRRR
jgi:GT2 family glycosyltransferase